MKYMTKAAGTLMLALVMTLCFGITAQAQDVKEGKKAVAMICSAFDKMGETVANASDMRELDNLDFQETLGDIDFGSIKEETAGYVLAPEDKEALKTSFGGFINSIIDKTVELYGDQMPREVLAGAMTMVSNKFNNLIDNATTLADAADALNELDL